MGAMISLLAGAPWRKTPPVAQPKRKRLRDINPKYGQHEVQISLEGGMDLPKSMEDCNKHSGHHEFIPVSKFSKEDLPPGYRHDNVFNCILALATITVRVEVGCVSLNRPEEYPDLDLPFPLFQFRGHPIKTFGSGWVSAITKYGEEDERDCECDDCTANPDSAKKQWGWIELNTADHVVFDSEEAEATTCRFFFDQYDDLDQCPTVTKAKRLIRNIGKDWSKLEYFTHNMELVNTLVEAWGRYQTLCKLVGSTFIPEQANKVQGGDFEKPVLYNAEHPLSVLVGHPHGYSKMVSLGETVKRDVVNGFFTQYTYTTPSCPGNSGGPVYMPGRQFMIMPRHPHHGAYSKFENVELNMTCTWFE